MARPEGWQSTVAQSAIRHKLSDPRLLYALGELENGDDGVEFGFGRTKDELGLTGTRPEFEGFERQADLAGAKIAEVEGLYRDETGEQPLVGGTYTRKFLSYFSQGGELYPGYASVDDNDFADLNENHAGALTNVYTDMSTDLQRGIRIPYQFPDVKDTRPVMPFTDSLDVYVDARKREETLGMIRQVVGPRMADYVAAAMSIDVGEALRNGQRLTQPLTTYLGENLGEAFNVLEKGGRLFRGALKGQPGTELSVEEFTGLTSEPVVDSPALILAGGSLGAVVNYPKRAANFGVELGTDPLIAGTGAVQAVGKVVKGVKAGVKVERITAAEAKVADEAAGGAEVQMEAHRPGHIDTRAGQPGTGPIPREESGLNTTKGERRLADAKRLRSEVNRIERARQPFVKAERTEQQGAFDKKELRRLGLDDRAFGAAQKAAAVADRKVDRLAGIRATATGDPELDVLFREVRATIDGAKAPRAKTSAEAQAHLDDGAVSIDTILRGEVTGATPGELAAMEVVRDRAAAAVAKVVERTDLSQSAKEDLFLATLRTAERLAVAVRPLEMRAGQLVDVTKTGNTAAGRAVEELLEQTPPGAPVSEAMRIFGLLKKGKERDAYIRNNATAGQKLKGIALQLYLNTLLLGFKTPVYNLGAMTALSTAKVFERWRMMRFTDEVVPGEAATMARSFFGAYYKLLTRDKVVKARFVENFEMMKKLGTGVNQGDIVRLRAVEKALADSGTSAKVALELSAEREALTRTIGDGKFNKFSVYRAISSETFNATGRMGQAIDVLGHVANSGVYAVGGTDLLFRFAVQTMVADSLAHRMAYRNVHAAVKAGKQLDDKATARLVQAERERLMQHPDSNEVEFLGQKMTLNDAGRKEADLVAMMEQLTGGLAGVDKTLRNSLLGRTFAPFFRVMALTTRESFARVPVFNRMVPSVNTALLQGGEAGAKAKAQVSTGWAMAAVTAGIAWAGQDGRVSIVGGGPTGKASRGRWLKHNEPYTIRIRNDDGTRTEIPYDRFAPVGNVLSFIVDMAYLGPRALSTIPDDDETQFEATSKAMVDGMTAAMVHMSLNSLAARDYEDLMAALNGDNAAEEIARMLARKTPGFVGASSFGKLTNDVLTGERKAVDGFLSQWASKVPGFAEGMAPYRDGWGEKEEYPLEGAGDIAAHYVGIRTRPFDPGDPRKTLDDEMIASRVGFSVPRQVQGGVRLSLDQHEQLKYAFGKGVFNRKGDLVGFELDDGAIDRYTRANGRPDPDKASLTSRLTAMMFDLEQPAGTFSPEWAFSTPGKDGSRRTLVGDVVGTQKDLAMRWLLQQQENTELRIAIEKRKIQRTPTNQPGATQAAVQDSAAQITKEAERLRRRTRRAVNDLRIGN